MTTNSNDYIQECATFIEENCFDPNILYGEHQYSDSEIYKTILGRYCIELNDAPALITGHVYNKIYIVESDAYIKKWLTKYSPIVTNLLDVSEKLDSTEKEADILNKYIKQNELKHGLYIDILPHTRYRRATITVNQIENRKDYNNSQHGLVLQQQTLSTEDFNKLIQNSNLKSIIHTCIYLMSESSIGSIKTRYTRDVNRFNLCVESLYNSYDSVQLNNKLKLNAFVLYSKLNNIEYASSKQPIIDLAIDMNMTFAQTLDLYKKDTNPTISSIVPTLY